MRYAFLIGMSLFLFMNCFAMEDSVALELRAMESGNSSNRSLDIESHFGSLIELYKKRMAGSCYLEEQLAELNSDDFQRLLSKPGVKRGGGWFGRGNDELLILMTELNRLRSDNERLARENEDLMREKYERCKSCSSWTIGIITTLCAGSGIANSILGGQLSNLLANPPATITSTLGG